jgi:hypothetical protein
MILFLVGLVGVLACRPAPIEYPDSTWGSLDTASSTVDQFLGPNPYEEGDARLSLGIFYEGGFSEEIPIDEVDSFFYIWVQEGTDTPTLSQSPTIDRVEGNLADEITAGSLGWFGSGISWNSAQDLSQWETMHLSVKSSDVVLEGIEVGMGGQTSSVGSCSGVGVRQNWESLSDYGFVADGEWHHVEIPLSELDLCLELEQIVEPFMFLMTGLSFGDAGSKILFDNLYFTED